MTTTNIAARLEALSILHHEEIAEAVAKETVLLEHISAYGAAFSGSSGAQYNVDCPIDWRALAEPEYVPNMQTEHLNVTMTVRWAPYRAFIRATQEEVDLAEEYSTDMSDWWRVFGERLTEAQVSIAKDIEKDAIVGSGINGDGDPTLVGLFGGALDVFVDDVSRKAVKYWRPKVLDNNGQPRLLSSDLIQQAEASIKKSSGEQNKRIILTSPENIARLPLDPYWKVNNVLRVAGVPAGQLAILSRYACYMQWLRIERSKETERFAGVEESNIYDKTMARRANGMPVEAIELNSLSENRRLVMLETYVAFAVSNRRQCAIIKDIDEGNMPEAHGVNDHVCPQCGNDRCSKREAKCWRCGQAL